jgi:excisionase family DNA binding protein
MKNMFTIKQLAEHLGVHANTVRRWIKLNEIGYVKIGGTYRISKEMVDRFMNKESKGA